MIAKLFLVLFFASTITSNQYSNTGYNSSGQTNIPNGTFLPRIQAFTSSSNSTNGDGDYIRFCKSVCYLYVPLEKTCGTNNRIYENACQARCDRAIVDKSRLFFNNKCCCGTGSQIIDFGYLDEATPSINSSQSNAIDNTVAKNFCVHFKRLNTIETSTTTTKYPYNIFSVPPCIADCLGIASVTDLQYHNPKNHTIALGCGRYVNAIV